MISANLPSSVPFGYSIDLGALCGTGASATVTTWLRDPAGAERQVNQSSGYGSAFEASFGVELSAYGSYAHWLDVACPAGIRRVEEGGFTVVGGESGATKARACARAKRLVKKARTRYRKASKALRREDTKAHRRAVRGTKAKLRTAKQHSRTACAKR